VSYLIKHHQASVVANQNFSILSAAVVDDCADDAVVVVYHA
jgi:hypothetical protein